MPRQPPPPDDPHVVEARGLRCPLPVLRLARAMREAPEVNSFELRSDDPATAVELDAWCRETGHRVMSVECGRFIITRS